MERCMIDIESLGIRPGSVVLSVGAVVFDKRGTETEMYRNISLEDSMSHGLEIESRTLKWWMEQGEEAKKCLDGDMSLEHALGGLETMIDETVEVWAKSPKVDLSLLESVYDAVGMEEPWHYSKTRDMRTLISTTDVDYTKVEPETKHHALDDARAQAEGVSEILRKM